MALYNEILAGRFNRFLQKHLSMKGLPPSPQLAGDIQPVLALYLGEEANVHQGWEPFAIDVLQPAAVGAGNELRLRNPTLSGVIVRLESIYFSANSVSRIDLQYGQPGADLGTSQAAAVRSLDTRGRAQSVLVASSAQPAAQSQIGTNINSAFTAANTWTDFLVSGHQLLLLPTSAVQLSDSTLNISTVMGFRWWERALEDSEVT